MGGRNSGSGYKENKNQMVTILSKGRMIINKAAGKIKELHAEHTCACIF
jgi:hypothetical protein